MNMFQLVLKAVLVTRVVMRQLRSLCNSVHTFEGMHRELITCDYIVESNALSSKLSHGLEISRSMLSNKR